MSFFYGHNVRKQVDNIGADDIERNAAIQQPANNLLSSETKHEDKILKELMVFSP